MTAGGPKRGWWVVGLLMMVGCFVVGFFRATTATIMTTHTRGVSSPNDYSVSYLQNNKIRRAIILFHSVPTTQKIRIIIQYNEDYQQYLLRNTWYRTRLGT